MPRFFTAPEELPPEATDLVDEFAERGYLIFPGLLPDDLVHRLRSEVDRWVDDGLRATSIACCKDPERHGLPPVIELELPAHGDLITHPPLMELLGRLMGTEFAFHHQHSNRQAPGLAGKPWHHDYEHGPLVDPGASMIHTLNYLDGLDEDTSALVVLPGSHREVATKTARADHGTAALPGEVAIGALPRGSTVVLHSALFHARRPPRRGSASPRYMIDTSYCQAGTRWPPVKPYWRHMLRRGRELGLDRGRWPQLFAERHFSEYVKPA